MMIGFAQEKEEGKVIILFHQWHLCSDLRNVHTRDVTFVTSNRTLRLFGFLFVPYDGLL